MINQPAVHRLDMYTSGLMVFAVTSTAHRFLSGQFEERAVVKKYIVLSKESSKGAGGEIHLPFRLDPNNRPLQIYDPVHGKMGITSWRKLDTTSHHHPPGVHPPYRAHPPAPRARSPSPPMGLGAPIVGDSLYGSGKEGDEMLLHATFLQFIHPTTRKRCRFTPRHPSED